MAFLRVDTRPLFPKIRAALLDLLEELEPGEWSFPTVCEQWDVKGVALHLLGVEIGNVARRRDRFEVGPAPGEGLAPWLNAHNEQWVAATRAISMPLLIDLLDTTGQMFDEYLADVAMDEVSASVSWVGDDPVPVWLDVAREYTERWIHQQQIRDATSRPGLKEPEFMEPLLQTFVHALPRTYRDVEAPDDAVVQLEVVGPGGGNWHIVKSASGWDLAEGAAGSPDARVSLDVNDAWRLFSRNPHLRPPTLAGDERFATYMLNAVAIVA